MRNTKKELTPMICPKCDSALTQKEIRNLYQFWKGPSETKCHNCNATISFDDEHTIRFKYANMTLKAGILILASGIIVNVLGVLALATPIYVGFVIALIGLLAAQPKRSCLVVLKE